MPDERPENGSPYNPEASPIDLDPSPEPFGQNGKASPSQAAVEDNNVDIMAYKGISAFDNIMKSKVKHEAKKHKRKKLEEMKHDLEQKSGVATSKEVFIMRFFLPLITLTKKHGLLLRIFISI